ncbi:MAG: hypothetical protein DRP65_03775, partial [Planctomycetota bacterium]
LTSQSLWVIRLFIFQTTNCVYRFISYQQDNKAISSTVPDKNLPLLLPDGRGSEPFSYLLSALRR